MAGSRTAGPIGREPSGADDLISVASIRGGAASAAPIGTEGAEAIGLAANKKISKVTKDWSDPPAVTPTLTPEISGKNLKEVLAALKLRTEWGTGGGKVKGTGPDGGIFAEPTEDGKSYTVALKAEFIMTLPKWKEYDTATPAQKSAWDAMFANLRMHEEEHVAIAYRGANKLVKTLTNLDITLAPQKVADANQEIQNNQDDFDSEAKTNHGDNDFGKFKRVFLDTTADPPANP
jgi:hypothetical protein